MPAKLTRVGCFAQPLTEHHLLREEIDAFIAQAEADGYEFYSYDNLIEPQVAGYTVHLPVVMVTLVFQKDANAP